MKTLIYKILNCKLKSTNSLFTISMTFRTMTKAKENDTKKGILIKQSRIINRPDELEGGEQAEIAAQITLPHDGGWGWLVVFAAFLGLFILDGVSYTFGSLLPDIAADLNVSESLVALINSIAVAMYFMGGPLASALINRFGFRECIMAGAIMCSFSLFTTYFTTKYEAICFFYGFCAGFGYCLINMCCGLIVGFYFERLRSVALALVTTGSSFGVMVLFPLNTYLVKLGGWRVTTLFHSGLFGTIFFLGMLFRPLLSLTVTKTEDDPTRTVTYLPSLTSAVVRPSPSRVKTDTTLAPTTAERLFNAVSNVNFPTAAAVVDKSKLPIKAGQAGPSTTIRSRLTLTTRSSQSGLGRRQLERLQSIVSGTGEQQEKPKQNLTLSINLQESEEPLKIGCWGKLCHWEPHTQEARPMYRDDAFYDGKVENLPVYKRTVTDSDAETRTGLEYQLAVSRAATVTDLTHNRGIFTTASRRVLATMMDPKLLKKYSFILMCSSGFFTYMGFLVPYIYLHARNEKAGIDPKHCTLFISAIGLSNAVGKIVLGLLASKIDPLKLFAFSCITAGISTILSDVSFNLYYQYMYCCVFGFTVASVACLRSIILVSLYGLDSLTNATGMMLIFLGIANLISTPIAAMLKNKFGYRVAFCVSGSFITLSGLVLLPVKRISKWENTKAAAAMNK